MNSSIHAQEAPHAIHAGQNRALLWSAQFLTHQSAAATLHPDTKPRLLTSGTERRCHLRRVPVTPVTADLPPSWMASALRAAVLSASFSVSSVSHGLSRDTLATPLLVVKEPRWLRWKPL